jgi:two-component system, cell cycle sensor histidine kinase and response regulator CckA
MDVPMLETVETKEPLALREVRKLAGPKNSDTARRESQARSTAGLAHDINNMLAIVRTCAESVADQPIDDRQRVAWDTVVQATIRGMGLTRRLLAISRNSMGLPGTVELNDVLCSLNGLLRLLVGSTVKLTVRTASVPLEILAEAGLVDQVILNLAQNASDAMPEGGELTLGLSATAVGTEHPLAACLSPGSYAVLSVRDTGIGMDAATRERIFEPFFSTKTPGERTGLGLAVVEDAVREMRGALRVESAPQQGSVFSVYLPLRQ